MAMIAIKVPEEVGAYLHTIGVPGKKVEKGSYHITIKYVHDPSDTTIINMYKACRDAAREYQGFELSMRKIRSFDFNPDDGFPIVLRTFSKELKTLEQFLSATLDERGVDYSRKYPEYKPHVTLSYSSQAVIEREIPTVMFPVKSFCLYVGETRDIQTITNFPLGLPPIGKHRDTAWNTKDPEKMERNLRSVLNRL